jgi:aryl-alcohol dehydrogenase-like predicted oxidoreductase
MHESDMAYTTLGRTGLRVSRVGLGAGGPSRLGRARDAEQPDIERLIGGALDLGVNFIDTARGYNTEDHIGRALQALGAHDVIIATKAWCYDVADGESPSRQPITDPRIVTDAVEASLRDLRREQIDLFQFHGVPPGALDAFVEHLLPVAETLRQQGKVRFLGVTEHPMVDEDQEMATPACASGLWDTVMIQYGIFDQAGHDWTFPPARRNDTGVICMSAARGALVNETVLTQALARGRLGTPDDLRFLLGEPPGTWAELAFRFAAACEDIDVVLVGTGNADHFEASARAITGPPLPPEQVDWLRSRFGHCRGGHVLWPGGADP